MFTLLCKSIPSTNFNSVQLFKLYSTLTSKARNPISLQDGNQDSFTVQYLVNQFGFLVEKAVLVSSKYVNFDKPDKPDLIIAYLKKHGFTESQIRKVVASYPPLLCSKPQKTLLPKIDFFRSKGCLEKDSARIISFIPKFFHRNLENNIVPSFNFLKDFLGSEKEVGAGMSESAIACLMESRPSIFVTGQDKLKESVIQVQNMDMDPESCGYGLALWILAVTCRRRTTWEKRMESYKKWGCSENDVLRNSKSCRSIMTISEDKLNGIMSLFVHEIGFKPSVVVKRYSIFELSLNKRLIPRWSVYKELLSKGLVKAKVGMSTMFKMKEVLFLKKFVISYKDEAPLLSKLYMEKQASK